MAAKTEKPKNKKSHLTAKNVAKKVKTPGRYRDADVRGLLLQVTTPGNASWILRYERDGRERWMGLGSCADFSLKEARERARAARQLLADGTDPLEHRKAARSARALAAAQNLTFEAACKQYYAQHHKKWRNAKHSQQFLSTLETYAWPKIGRLAVADIDVGRVLSVLEQHHENYPDARLWDAIPETASRLRGRVEDVLDWATVRGFRKGDNPARWTGVLDNVLPSRTAIRRVAHHPALPYADIPGFMAELRSREAVSARALEFLILTAARTGAVVGARWSEIDLKTKIWSVPPERAETKISGDEPRRVPLSERAIEILKGLPREEGNPHLFIGGKAGAGLSNAAMSELLKGLAAPSTTPGKLSTVHGMRSTFKDWVAERTNYPNFVSEAALWHAVADKVEKAYRRGDLFEKRRRLMADWARYCAAPPRKATGDNVVTLQGAE